ncbi:MAG: hypothetical protein IKN49_05255 [Elusimicrobiaceae bacterium]|nr:hypothetical protein [Elusimicrobiaceae bacterium]
MKKTVFFTLLAAMAFAGCASTADTATSSANTPLTLEEALQKSAETRQKLIEAKQAYQNAKAAASATNTDSSSVSAADLAKQAVQEKVNTVKTQLNDEKQAWKEALSN